LNPVAIVQARLGSSRLPGKVLLPLAGKPVLFHVVDRLRRVADLAEVVVATTDQPGDEPLRAYLQNENIPFFAGNETDVLDRYYRAAQEFRAGPVVRVTSDCPLIDPEIVQRAISLYARSEGRLQYVGFDPSFPDGLDVEVFAFDALETAWREAKLPSEREHVTPFIHQHPDRFPQDKIRHTEDLSAQRWTVDEPRDYELVKRVFEALYAPGRPFGMDDVLAFLSRNADVGSLNAGIVRNEGYLKSLKEDATVTRKRS
jgi:spore coat polysaccharide biosynthesis protein SpsF